MTRLKKEFRKRGLKLECDFEWLPYNGIETVEVDVEKAMLKIYHNSFGWSFCTMTRDGNLRYSDEYGESGYE